MQRQYFLILVVMLLANACTQFKTGRSYLSEMEHNDSRFFSPEHDFPVVSGDTGDFGISEEERLERTPKSHEDLTEIRHREALRYELRALEGELADGAQRFYEKHRDRLGSVSEKIYFLKLPHHERRDYLAGRGLLIEKQRAPASLPRVALDTGRELVMGMTKDEVLAQLGKPRRVEIAGNPSYENERWLYQDHGASKYVYFESGKVEGWE